MAPASPSGDVSMRWAHSYPSLPRVAAGKTAGASACVEGYQRCMLTRPQSTQKILLSQVSPLLVEDERVVAIALGFGEGPVNRESLTRVLTAGVHPFRP